MIPVRGGQRVKIRLSGRLPDGSAFYDGTDDEPLEFVAGGEEVMTGLAKAVIGMHAGERKTVAVTAKDGFGERDESLVVDVPRHSLPKEARIGDRIELSLQDGSTAPAWVKELHEECAHLDGNHPLAGEDLIFDIEVLSVSEP
jgi:peptidylprolyl isomerase